MLALREAKQVALRSARVPLAATRKTVSKVQSVKSIFLRLRRILMGFQK